VREGGLEVCYSLFVSAIITLTLFGAVKLVLAYPWMVFVIIWLGVSAILYSNGRKK